MGQLRNHGITLHLALKADRHPVPDVPVIYFVEPSEESISRIVSDYKSGMYSVMHLNFSSSISTSLLQRLGKEMSLIVPAPRCQISRVVDRYCSFVSLNQTCFSLNNHSMYYNLHRSGVPDKEIEASVERVGLGLLSVILTCVKQVPVIRAAANGPAAMVAQILNDKLEEFVNSQSSGSLFSSTAAVSADPSHAQRPLLVILDRDLDLSPLVAHGWSYEALCADLLGMNLNKLSIQKENKHFDIDQSESFWRKTAHLPFPEAATAVNDLVNEFSRLRGEVTSSESGLTTAVSALPQVTEMKKNVDMHTSIATALLNEVKSREIDKYYEIEQDLNINSLTQLLSSSEPNSNLSDKVRTAIFLLLRKDNIPVGKMDQLISQLSLATDLTLVNAMKYIKYPLSLRQVATGNPPPSSTGAPQVVLPGMLGDIAGKMKSHGEGLLKNLKNILPVNGNLVVTNTVQQLADQVLNPLTDSFVYFDPRNPRSSVRVRGNFRQVIVCVVGGGCVIEAENVSAWAQKTNRTVIYGATDFPSPVAFLSDISKLST